VLYIETGSNRFKLLFCKYKGCEDVCTHTHNAHTHAHTHTQYIHTHTHPCHIHACIHTRTCTHYVLSSKNWEHFYSKHAKTCICLYVRHYNGSIFIISQLKYSLCHYKMKVSMEFNMVVFTQY